MIERVDEHGTYLVIRSADDREFTIDVDDRGVLGDHVWKVYERDEYSHYVYRSRGAGIALLHREIMQAPSGLFVDHRDWNGLNCRRYNMRLATLAQNTAYTKNRKLGKSGVRGAYPLPDGRYYAMASLNGKLKHLGIFATAEEAGRARDAAILAVRGEFTVLNFPEAR